MKDLNEYRVTEPMSALEIIRERIIPIIQEDHRRIRMGLWAGESPECGTVACIGGWINWVAAEGLPKGGCLSERAERLVPPHLRHELHSAFYGGYHFSTPDGTPKQQEAVISFLNNFCERHEKDLRCWIIDPTSEGLGSEDVNVTEVVK